MRKLGNPTVLALTATARRAGGATPSDAVLPVDDRVIDDARRATTCTWTTSATCSNRDDYLANLVASGGQDASST